MEDQASKAPDLPIIIVSYNTRKMTLDCLKSVFRETRETRFELIVLHNASRDGSAERRIRIGPDAAVSPNAVFANPQNIEIGARLRLDARCALWAGRGRVRIDDDVLFEPDTLVTAPSCRFNDGQPVAEQAMDEADVTIGDDAWIGAKAIILPEALLADGAIVRRKIPPMAIAAGAPARVAGARRLSDLASTSGGAAG